MEKMESKRIFSTEIKGKFVSINKKYTLSKSRRLILTKEYRNFKNFVGAHCKQVKSSKFEISDKPLRIDFVIRTYKDIDNMEKCVIDGMQNVVYKDDSKIIEKHTYKIPQKRGEEELIKIKVYEII